MSVHEMELYTEKLPDDVESQRVVQASGLHFNIQLSGHSHGGRIFIFNFFVALAYPFVRGEYYLGEGSVLHVNRDTGTWGPSVRVGSPPEITLVHIRSKP